MKVTVIIPTMLKNRDYLTVCVESLLATTDWDILVSENGAPFDSEFDCSNPRRVGYIFDSRQGQCMAVNAASAVVPKDTDFIFICNDDMYFAPGWNKNLRFDYDVFSPNLVEPTNNPGSAPPFLKCDAGFTLDEFNKEAVDKFVKENIDGESLKEETGFNFPVFFRKSFWDTIGGYDERYDPWGSNSDSDLQCAAALGGVQSMRLRDVLVYHFSNKSGTFDGTHQAEWQQNWDYFTEKWGFNRDMIGTDVWYSKNLLPEDKSMIKFKPPWSKYA